MGAGLIQWDFGYQRETTFLRDVPSIEALQQFVGVVKAYSNAGIRKYAFVQPCYVHEHGQDAASQDTDAVLLIELEYFDADHVLCTMTLPLPAPKRDMLVLFEGRGYRLPREHGEIIAAAYSLLTGEDYTYRDGWVLA